MKLKKSKNANTSSNEIGILIKNVTNMGYFSNRKWDKYTKREKRNILFLCIVFIVLFAGCCVYVHYLPDIFKYFINWSEILVNSTQAWLTAHIPSFISIIVGVVSALSLYYLLKCVNNALRFKTQKGKTLFSLLISILDYVIFIVAFLFILATWGVDTVAILASAGVVTLIIGFGAQSLVEDLISGVVVALEGNISVGDLVVFRGYIGTVREIGLRVTKIENFNNHVNIVRNSEISTIVNTSKEDCYHEMIYAVDKQHNVDDINALFNKNLDRIKNSSPEIDELFYIGLMTFNLINGKYGLAFTAKNNRSIQCKVAINREIYSIFTENGIKGGYDSDSFR